MLVWSEWLLLELQLHCRNHQLEHGNMPELKCYV